MNKKGDLVKKLMWIIVTIVVIVTLLYFISRPFASTLRRATGDPVEDCRTTLDLMTRGEKSFLFEADIKFDCETNWYGNLTFEEKDPEKRKKEALDQVMPLVADCWYQFEEGRARPFEQDLLLLNDYCFICASFKIPESPGLITNEEIEEYFRNNRYSRNREFYSDYLSNDAVSKSSIAIHLNQKNEIGVDIIMIIDAGGDWIRVVNHENFAALECKELKKTDPNILEE
jgi:hypothetical protein